MDDTLDHVPEAFRAAHRLASNHRAAVLASVLVGCFYCLECYQPAEIRDWIDDNQTALCPRCGIDAVLPDTAGLTQGFLRRMHHEWFTAATPLERPR